MDNFNNFFTSRAQRVARLKRELQQRILVMDGATGTCIQDLHLSAQDFGGEKYEGCNEYLVITRPDLIANIHRSYLEAGADIIETNTFGGTPLVLAEYQLEGQFVPINQTAAIIARREADTFTRANPARPRFVAGSMGPTTKAISVTGGVEFTQLIENFALQAQALYDGGVDYFLVETCQDTRNIKAALLGINQVLSTATFQIPVAVSVTIEPMGTMLAGQSVEALVTSLEHVDLLYVGLNCATGPEMMGGHIRAMAQMSNTHVACVPNAGLPDEEGRYLETPEMMVRGLERFIDGGQINIIGGCCGTHAKHIAAFVELAGRKKPRTIFASPLSRLSGIDYLEVTAEKRPILVGEKTNVIGSKQFRDLIVAEEFDRAAEIAKEQVKKGADIIDVCLANPDRNELEDMEKFLAKLVQKVRAPLMIDSTDEKVIARALTYCQGKAIINSINLEDGEERFEKICPLARSMGAALVVGTIDEDPIQGMGITRERKLAIATRSYQLLTAKYGISPWDIYWDCLVFPCATGDVNYRGSALETIEAIRLIKAQYPQTKTILGISNVSFGLPPAGREVLNGVFLYHCTLAGLDLAIVNTEKLRRFSSLTPLEIDLAENLLFDRGTDPVAAFTNHFRQQKSQANTDNGDWEQLPTEERVAKYVIEGRKNKLLADLDLLMTKYRPMEIINGPLMAGMSEVGRLFNLNQLIVAEVLQSAEVMKAAVSYLENFMEKQADSKKGKMLLATVKGDVHDIGKNLVDIVFSNNGIEVINLGIKITSEQLLAAYDEHRPDFIGLSGLLVKSAQQMALTAEDLARAQVQVPILVGGAALSRNFTNQKIAPNYPAGTVCYAKDAMEGLELANTILDPAKFAVLREKIKKEQTGQPPSNSLPASNATYVPGKRSANIPILEQLPSPPDFTSHILKNINLDLIWPYLNPLMLYGRHLGIKGKYARDLGTGNYPTEHLASNEGQKAWEIYQTVLELKNRYQHSHLVINGVYQFFRARSEDDRVIGLDEPNWQLTFPRQKKENGLCLSDYLHPTLDNLGILVVTAGKNIRQESALLKERGDYLRSHILQALALELAEATAEYLHAQMRRLWGIQGPSSQTLPMADLFAAKYQGKRYSFGYPACPNLEDQRIIFQLLKPEASIGVQLTEGFMMDPEASVSALVFHHPQAVYFAAGSSD